jgi:hypothetical protein
MKALIAAGLAFAALMSSPPALADDAGDLAAIRALYAKIDQGKPGKTETIAFALESDPMEGSITRRTYGGGLSAIQLSYTAGDHGGADERYYFDGDKLFFIFTGDSSWQFAEGSTDEKPKTQDTLTESRYYIREGKVIQVLQRSATTTEGKKPEDLIAKMENKKLADDKHGAGLMRRAAALVKIKTKEQAVKFFSSEEP